MANEAQADLWGHDVGAAWVDHAAAYDEGLRPFGIAAMERLDLQSGQRVLDLGCGTGETTVELARRVAPGEVLGVDLSTPMLAAATERAAHAGADGVTFRNDDIQTTDLGTATFDRAFSRMGVMFFADPVAAFANVATALRPGGRIGFACFQDFASNPGLILPILAVAEILELPPPDPNTPGPFSLADPEYTSQILATAGFDDIELVAGPDHIVVSGADDLRLGATRMLVQNPMVNPRFLAADTATKDAALDAVVAALTPHRHGDSVHLDTATWIVTADKPA